MTQMLIDLTKVEDLLDLIDGQVQRLHGRELDERSNPDKEARRDTRVERSRDLQLLAHRLKLAGELVMNEYWHARGESEVIYERNLP